MDILIFSKMSIKKFGSIDLDNSNKFYYKYYQHNDPKY